MKVESSGLDTGMFNPPGNIPGTHLFSYLIYQQDSQCTYNVT